MRIDPSSAVGYVARRVPPRRPPPSDSMWPFHFVVVIIIEVKLETVAAT